MFIVCMIFFPLCQPFPNCMCVRFGSAFLIFIFQFLLLCLWYPSSTSSFTGENKMVFELLYKSGFTKKLHCLLKRPLFQLSFKPLFPICLNLGVSFHFEWKSLFAGCVFLFLFRVYNLNFLCSFLCWSEHFGGVFYALCDYVGAGRQVCINKQHRIA